MEMFLLSLLLILVICLTFILEILNNTNNKIISLKNELDEAVLSFLKEDKRKEYLNANTIMQSKIFNEYVNKSDANKLKELIDNYNNNALKLNSLIKFFPINIIASIFKYKEFIYYVKK